MAATEELLGLLHEATAAELLARVQSGEATPAELSVIVKFLKDNGIEAIPSENNSLGRLVSEMPEFTDEGGLHGRH